MRRANGEPKIYGPYKHRDQWRVHVVTRRGGKGKTVYETFETRALADAFIAGARDEAQGVTVSAAIEGFLAHKRELELVDATVESAEDRLAMLLSGCMSRPIRHLVGRGPELYSAAQIYPEGHRQAGQRRAADTHRNALAMAKDFGRFCVRQKWLKADPWAEVDPVGRKVLGADKSRLTVDESRKLQAYCHKHAASDPGAVLTLAYLLLGPRASELVKRDVRDLDDGGRLLWIGRTKTKAGRRRLLVPDELVPLLVGVAAGRPGDAPLFVHPEKRRRRGRSPGGARWSRHVAYGHVKRVCVAAGVPELPPQALRRTQATLATDAGATALMVAAHLGHDVAEAPAVTGKAYIGRDAASDAQAERAFRVIAGGRR